MSAILTPTCVYCSRSIYSIWYSVNVVWLAGCGYGALFANTRKALEHPHDDLYRYYNRIIILALGSNNKKGISSY